MKIEIRPDGTISIEIQGEVESHGNTHAGTDATPEYSSGEIIYSDFPIHRRLDGGWEDGDGHPVRFVATRGDKYKDSVKFWRYTTYASITPLFKETSSKSGT